MTRPRGRPYGPRVTYTTTQPRIWWQEEGHGSPLLLVMGQAFGSRMWHRGMPALAAQHRVLSYDNRGIGRSTARRHTFSIPDLAADALAVLDAAGVERAHVYGVSMGGLVAQELALSHPDRVQSLVVGCSGAQDGSYTPRRRSAGLRRLVPRRLVLRLLPGPVTTAMYGVDPPRDLVREDFRILASTPAPGWVIEQQSQAISSYESRSRVADLQVPTLVLHGTHDRVVPLARGEELAGLVPDARLHVLDGAGHNYLTEAGDEANAVVLEFLAGVDKELGRVTV